jgi:hypothetical protein
MPHVVCAKACPANANMASADTKYIFTDPPTFKFFPQQNLKAKSSPGQSAVMRVEWGVLPKILCFKMRKFREAPVWTSDFSYL